MCEIIGISWHRLMVGQGKLDQESSNNPKHLTHKATWYTIQRETCGAQSLSVVLGLNPEPNTPPSKGLPLSPSSTHMPPLPFQTGFY